MAFLLDHTAYCSSSCCYPWLWKQQQYSRAGRQKALKLLIMFLHNKFMQLTGSLGEDTWCG